MRKTQPKTKKRRYWGTARSVPPGLLITFITSTKQLDVIGFHPFYRDVNVVSMVSSRRRTITKAGYESYDLTVRYTASCDRRNRTDLVMEISEQRFYGSNRRRLHNKIHTTVTHLSFNSAKPILLPSNSFDVEWKENADRDIVGFSQLVAVKDAYRQRTHFDARKRKTVLNAEFKEDSKTLNINNMMVAHRCITSPDLWPEGRKADPRYLRSILGKHLRAKIIRLTPAASKLQAELDIVSRTAHIKSCETCISDLVAIEFR